MDSNKLWLVLVIQVILEEQSLHIQVDQNLACQSAYAFKLLMIKQPDGSSFSSNGPFLLSRYSDIMKKK